MNALRNPIFALPVALFGALIVATSAGCVGVTALKPDAKTDDVRAAWGTPTSIAKTSGGERWVYSSAPEGRTVWLVDFDGNGRLASRVQGLTLDRITKIGIGQSQPEVEALIGPSYWSLRYPFKRDELVHVYRFMDVVTPTCFYVGYNASGSVTSTGMQQENQAWSRFGMLRPC